MLEGTTDRPIGILTRGEGEGRHYAPCGDSVKTPSVPEADPGAATPEGRKLFARSDAFITKGGHIVYVNRHSEVRKGARQGAAIYVCMLAAIIWHEMAHIDGADEE
jgi:hypothetical protein